MEHLLLDETTGVRQARGTQPWRRLGGWVKEKELSPGFWVIFAAAFFFDFGISIYVFMFNLYLLDLHFNDRSIGLVNGAAMLGTVLGTLPAGMLTRRMGLRPMLIACLIAAPAVCALRAVATGEITQIGMGFVSGLTLCMWGVCFLPAVARVTTVENRASGFSLIFSAGIGTGILGGTVCGYLPQWLARAGIAMHPVDVKRLILLVSCGIAALGIIPILRMGHALSETGAGIEDSSHRRSLRQLVHLDPFLLRFLPAMAIWTVVLTSFTPFANVYLSRDLHVPFLRIGLVFSAAQVVQLCVTLLSPRLFRWLGLVNGIVATQLLTAGALACLAGTRNSEVAVGLYLGSFGMQWMSSPGLYNLLMSNVPATEHGAASSMTLFCNALVGAASMAGAGMLFTTYGYPRVLIWIAALAIVAAVVLRSLLGPGRSVLPGQPRLPAKLLNGRS